MSFRVFKNCIRTVAEKFSDRCACFLCSLFTVVAKFDVATIRAWLLSR
jgi:hypothetical protein